MLTTFLQKDGLDVLIYPCALDRSVTRYNNYRLVIKEPLPDVWYKDEGGRDKCMLLNLQLLGESKKVAESVKVGFNVLCTDCAPVCSVSSKMWTLKIATFNNFLGERCFH